MERQLDTETLKGGVQTTHRSAHTNIHFSMHQGIMLSYGSPDRSSTPIMGMVCWCKWICVGVMTVHLFIYFHVASIKLILNICTAKGRLVSQQSREPLIFGLKALKPLMTSAEFALLMRTIENMSNLFLGQMQLGRGELRHFFCFRTHLRQCSLHNLGVSKWRGLCLLFIIEERLNNGWGESQKTDNSR